MKLRLTTGVAILTLVCALHALSRQAGGQNVSRLSLPDRDWALEIDLSGFGIMSEEVGGEAGGYQLYAGLLKGGRLTLPLTLLEARIEPPQGGESGADFQELLSKHLKKIKKAGGVKTSEYNRITVARYSSERWLPSDATMSSMIGGVGSEYQIIEAYLARDGCWCVVRMSAPKLKDADEKSFYSLLDSVRLVDTSAPSGSFDYYQKGRTLFLARNYRKAVEPLAAALSLERQNRRLDVAQWRNLVEMATDAYGATGDTARAKEVLEYGAGTDPTYPVFHLALARLHASLGDLDNTIAALEKAFAYKVDQPQALRLPNYVIDPSPRPLDPMSDPAFARFRKDERFRRAVKAMKK